MLHVYSQSAFETKYPIWVRPRNSPEKFRTIDGTDRTVLAGIGAGSVAVALGTFGIVGTDQHVTDDESDETSDDNGGEEETGRVRVAHLSPDAPAVDVVPSGSDDALVEDLEFGNREYVEVPADSYRLCIFAAGDREGAVFNVDADVAGNTVYSAFDVLLMVGSEGGDDDAENDTDAGMDAMNDNETDGNDDGY